MEGDSAKRMRFASQTILVLGLLTSTSVALAGNATFSGEFLGTEPMMRVPETCSQGDRAAYIEIGTIQVSESGNYRLVDAGQFTVHAAGIPDLVIHVYRSTFISLYPNSFREASVDVGEYVELEAGNNYILVIQSRCGAGVGPYAVALGGPGEITGAGFETPAFTYGQLTDASPEFVLPGGPGPFKYSASQPVQATRTGYYLLATSRVGFEFGVEVRVYQGAFSPQDPEQNLVPDRGDGSVLLLAGTEYAFVAYQQDNAVWQFVLFPPGQAGINAEMNGAWVSPGINSQGVLIETGVETGVLFLAWFTFPYGEDTPFVGFHAANSGGQSLKSANDIGSMDQRWLTAYGAFEEGVASIELNIENTSGGGFNDAEREPTIDSNYGTGSIEVLDCDHLVLNFELPGGVDGSNDLHRVVQEDTYWTCLSGLGTGVITEQDFLTSW